MARVATAGTSIRSEQITAELALRIAWISWLTMLAIPFVLFIAAVWIAMGDDGIGRTFGTESRAWFYVAVAYLITAVPVSFFFRSHVFKAYWTGECVSPRNYLRGMLAMWLTIEVGGIIALLGCIATKSLLPNLMPALVAFMLFTPLWPSGRAMVRHCGSQEDPEMYEEPR
jgi:hypothetical protein